MWHPTRVFRDKMVANHVNTALEILLQIVVLVGAPFLWLFGLFHDHIMMKFLNNTYIHNVSWALRFGLLFGVFCLCAAAWLRLNFTSPLGLGFCCCFTLPLPRLV